MAEKEKAVETETEEKVYKYKLDSSKTSGIGLKGNKKFFNIVKKTNELTLEEIKENFVLIKKGILVFVGPEKEDPSKNEELIKAIEDAAKQNLSTEVIKASVTEDMEKIETQFKEKVASLEKVIAEQKKEITKLTKDIKTLTVENERLEKELKK